MLENHNSPHDHSTRFVPRDECVFNHPDDVLSAATLTQSEKRSLLASWASDAHSVENAPALRQIETGAIISLADILTALNRLDDAPDIPAIAVSGPRSFGQKRASRLSQVCCRASLLGRANDDDDDPPPGGAAARPLSFNLQVNARAA